MIRVVFTSGPHQGSSVLKVPSWDAGKAYIERQRPGVREHLGVLETHEKQNGKKGEAAK